MPVPFTQSSDTLYDFFQVGRGFYVPYYQRPFSWKEENARKLISDLTSSLRKVVRVQDHAMFLGTIILFTESRAEVGIHFDSPTLVSTVCNVVDGQQRISSLGMLASVLIKQIAECGKKISPACGESEELKKLLIDIEDSKEDLLEFFSFYTKKHTANPRRKPKIIRAGDASSNPRADQWTLSGNSADYYRSDVAAILAASITDYCCSNVPAISAASINGADLPQAESASETAISAASINGADLPQAESAARSVLNKFSEDLNAERKLTDFEFVKSLVACSETSGSPLKGFLSFPPTPPSLLLLDVSVLQDVFEAIYLLAFSAFLKRGCYVLTIDCLDESLAFDMFQALNATGTPLTAFEVFKPRLVKCWGPQQYPIQLLPFVNRAEKVFDLETSASGKETIAARVIKSVAMVFAGKDVSTRFSDQRDWLIESLPEGITSGGKSLVISIAHQAEYYNHFIKPKRTKRDSPKFKLVTHLVKLGINPNEADLAALCVYFLRDASHQMAHYLLSVYYSALLEAQNQNNPDLIVQRASNFVEASKAVACFWVLWIGADTGKFPDAEYRSLFDQSRSNISILTGKTNQTASFLKAKLRELLVTHKIFVNGNPLLSKANWVTCAKNTAWYTRRVVTKFALFAAFHDAVPDTVSGNEGLMTTLPGSYPFLTCQKWHSTKLEVIEHVATQAEPERRNFLDYFDQKIYPGNNSQVDRIGNLTLLSRAENSSVHSEWPEKIFFYWNLTMPSATANGPEANELQQKLGIINLPPSLIRLQAASTYASHLAPLVVRGIAGKQWDAAFIEQRSIHLCERVFDKLVDWIS